MRKVRILVVDDSVVVRRLLTTILSAEPDFEVVGAAADGTIGLAKITQVNPDIVTMDVEMPGMSGLETLVEIRKRFPNLPVLMFSSRTETAARTTLEAIALGATDYVTKPSGTGSREASEEHVRAQLVPRIRELGARADALSGSSPAHRRVTPIRTTVRRTDVAPSPVDVLAIGASTGGPNALTAMLAAIPKTLACPVVIVQHMPPIFTRLFAERLSVVSQLSVVEAVGGEVMQAGRAYVAPGDHHLRVVREGAVVRCAIDRAPPENSCRPAVDVLFRSVAAVFGARSLAVVLTGMGQDGLRGAEHLKEAGAQIVVQDERSSVVWGMPGIIARAGLADAILPLPEIAQDVLRRVALHRGARPREVSRVD
ncbi:MAG: chemotaxis response regulator protein-glutamate methylesterase [Polyangiaceae bacterium]